MAPAGSAAAVVEEVAQEGPLSGDGAFSSLQEGLGNYADTGS